jgi:hypothetical protein
MAEQKRAARQDVFPNRYNPTGIDARPDELSNHF